MSFDILRKAVVPMDYPRTIVDNTVMISKSVQSAPTIYEVVGRDAYTMSSPGYTAVRISGDISMAGTYNASQYTIPEFHFKPFPTYQYVIGEFPTRWYLISFSIEYGTKIMGYPGGYWNFYLDYDYNNGRSMLMVEQNVFTVGSIGASESGSFSVDIWVDTYALPNTQLSPSNSEGPIMVDTSSVTYVNCSLTYQVPFGNILP